MEVAGPLGTPLGLAQRKRASPRGEAGTSGFLCVSDSDRRVPAELGRDGVSREVPCSALKGKTVPESLHATPQKFPDTPGSLEGNTEVPGTASYGEAKTRARITDKNVSPCLIGKDGSHGDWSPQ